MLTAAIAGFLTGFSLILAIGAQNAFVLRQGLMQAHVFVVCLMCALSDAILISIGVAGMGTLGLAFPAVVKVLAYAGAAFLIAYGLLSMRRAFKPGTLRAAEVGTGSLGEAVITCLALTWLNPHVYLDTVGLIGAVSVGFEGAPARISYAVGAILSSFAFFFMLGYGARFLAPFFEREAAWRVLDVLIALIMWSIAFHLIADPAAAGLVA